MMNALRTILLLASLLTVLAVSAQTNAQTRRRTATTPPAAMTCGLDHTHTSECGAPGTTQRLPQYDPDPWADRDGRYDYDRDRRDDWDRDGRYDYDRDRRDNPKRPAYLPAEWNRPYRGRHAGRWQYALKSIFRAFTPKKPDLWGAVIIGHDDTFLGVISKDRKDEDAVTNGWGRFGSPQSPWSIWNPEGRWGSKWAPHSPWNPQAARPPKVYEGNAFRGYLTTNPRLYPRIDPHWLRQHLNVPRW
jgi:hypothetical protein